MVTMLKQELLDHLVDVVETNQRLNKNIKNLEKIAPQTYFEMEVKNTLKQILENQKELNNQINIISGLLIKKE